MYVTFSELFLFCNMIVSLINLILLIVQIKKK